MPIIKDGTTLKAINYNGTSIKKVIYNGTVVFTSNITVSWRIYIFASDTGIYIEFGAEIVDSEPLSPSDVVTFRMKDTEDPNTGEDLAVNLTVAHPSSTIQTTIYIIDTTLEFLVNNELKTTTTWSPPSREGTRTGSVTFEP